MIEVHFINVGYGDAALILQKALGRVQFCMLIDCGGATVGDNDPAGFRVTAAEYVKKLGIKRIDIVLLSHLHLDHSGGILAIAEHFDVRELWTSYVPDENAGALQTNEALSSGSMNLMDSLRIYAKALKMLRAKNTVIRTITTGLIKNCPAGTIRIYAGNKALYERQAEILDAAFAQNAADTPLRELHGFINNTSLRAEAVLHNTVFLFAGDICASEWEKEGILGADVVKLPHHCHADSMNETIAKQLASKYTVISVSNTRTDNCPDPYIIKILKEFGSSVLFTDAVNMPDFPVKKHHAVVFNVDTGGLLALKFNN